MVIGVAWTSSIKKSNWTFHVNITSPNSNFFVIHNSHTFVVPNPTEKTSGISNACFQCQQIIFKNVIPKVGFLRLLGEIHPFVAEQILIRPDQVRECGLLDLA